MAPSAAPTPQRTSSKRPEDDEVKPYVLVGDLGKGSFATVYKGYHEVCLCPSLQHRTRVQRSFTQETRQEVAIKTVSRSTLSTKLFENLQSEIDILKSLSHRHITKLIDIVVRSF